MILQIMLIKGNLPKKNKKKEWFYVIFIIEGKISMKKIFKYMDKPLLIITVALFVFGLVMVFSASNVTAYMSHAVSPYNYFIKQAIFLIGGLILSMIIIRFNTRSYGFFSWTLLILVTISLVLLLIIGKAKTAYENGQTKDKKT